MLFVAVAILIIIAIVIIGTFYFKNNGIRYFRKSQQLRYSGRIFWHYGDDYDANPNKYFGIAALLLAIIPIPDIMTLVKNKILHRRRAELIDLSSILHQAAQTSQTEMLLGERRGKRTGAII